MYYTFSYDPQGNLAVTNASNKQAITPALSVSVYDGYGNRLASQDVSSGTSPEPHQDPVGFGGQEGYYTDTETGLVLLGARYYDPSTGRFLNRDPIGYGGGINLYGFCGNNPVNESDPMGTSDDDDIPTSEGAVFKSAVKTFKADPEWKAGSPQRTEVGNFVDSTPILGTATTAYTAATGKSFIGGGKVSGWQRFLAVVGTLLVAVHIHANASLSVRPFADNDQLNKNVIEQFYRGKWINGQWVSDDGYLGGLAGAIRREKATGDLVGGVSHIPKGEERLVNLKRILQSGKIGNDVLSPKDMAIVRSLHDDLQNALQGK